MYYYWQIVLIKTSKTNKKLHFGKTNYRVPLSIFLYLILIVINSCEKFPFDYRSRYVGVWTFEVTNSQSNPISPVNSVSYFEGSISYGAENKDILIIYSANNTLIRATLDRDGTLGNLPGDYNYGNFIGKNEVTITFGHRGNSSNLTYIYGRKGIFLNTPPGVSTDFSYPLTYGAYLGGTVSPNGITTTISFEYGPTDSYGNTISAIQNPVTGIKTSSVGADITGLTPGTTYHFRAKVVNQAGTFYGKDLTVTTNAITDPVGDIDGNLYPTVRIGNQTWMAENLKVTRYNEGSSIPLAVENNLWVKTTFPGYCYYNNDIAYKNVYGCLYNWYVVKTGKLCPAGWHVPADKEFTTLENYLVSGNVGGILKEAGTSHWLSPNTRAINSSGFTALPGGDRDLDGPFYNIGKVGYWWSSTEDESGGYSWTHYLFNDADGYNRLHLNNTLGFSVRCIKDN